MYDQDEKKRRDRSPAFPYISLKESVDRLEKFIAAYNKHPARLRNVAELWKYSPASSSFGRNVAALKAFGLVDDSGSGEDRKISASALGSRIVSDKRPGAREEGLKKAFESCDILLQYYRKWGWPRPPEYECVSELTLDSNFTNEAARKFISVYDESLSFANYTSQAVQPEPSEEPSEHFSDDLIGEIGKPESPPSDVVALPSPATSAPPEISSFGGRMKHATYPLKEGNCTLTWPSEISPKSARKLKRWLELMLDDVTDPDDEDQDDDL